MSSVNAAVMAVLAAVPVVGPGALVAGTVITTRGRVVSGAMPVVKLHWKGLASDSPVAMLLAPVTIAV